MLRRIALSASFLLLCAAPASSQIVGRVVEHGTSRPLRAVSVTLVDDGETVRGRVMTDSLGQFAFGVQRQGSYRVLADQLGYAGARSDVIEYRGRAVQTDLRLTPRPVQLDTLTVRDRPSSRLDSFYERMRRYESLGLGEFFTRTQLESRTNQRVSDVLTNVAFLQVPMRGGRITSRSRSCQVSYYVDGVRLRSLMGQAIDDVLRVADLEGIEVYRGRSQLPAEYSDPQTRGCPVVAFWTRRGN